MKVCVFVTVLMQWRDKTTMANLTKESILLCAGLYFQRSSPLTSWQRLWHQTWCWSSSWKLHADLQTEQLNQAGAFETSNPTHSDTFFNKATSTPIRPHLLIQVKYYTTPPYWWSIQIYEPTGAILIQTTTLNSLATIRSNHLMMQKMHSVQLSKVPHSS